MVDVMIRTIIVQKKYSAKGFFDTGLLDIFDFSLLAFIKALTS